MGTTPKASPSTAPASRRNWKSRPCDMGYQPMRSAVKGQSSFVAESRSHGLVPHVTGGRIGNHDERTLAVVSLVPVPPTRRGGGAARAEVREVPAGIRLETARGRQRRRR